MATSPRWSNTSLYKGMNLERKVSWKLDQSELTQALSTSKLLRSPYKIKNLD